MQDTAEANGSFEGKMSPFITATKRIDARPGAGEVKGRKIIIDPMKHKDKAHKASRPTYRDFGATEFRPPPDPRLALPGYRDGQIDPSCVPVAKMWKQKLRLAPQVLSPYTWSEYTSIGSGPATAIVVLGFNRLTSETQLRTFFSSFGEVASVESKVDPMTGTPLGICRIQYRDSRSEGIPASEAAKRAEEHGSGQRMGNVGEPPLRVERDRVGRKCARMVARAAQNMRDREAQEDKAREVSRKAQTDNEPSPLPPPNAPKGPAGRHHAPRPQPLVTAPAVAAPPVSAARAADSLIEDDVLSQIKRRPYIFISHSSVPVMGTTIPHLQKRLKSYKFESTRLDRSGYYIVFEDSRWGEEEAVRCYEACNGNPLFTYTMFMELQRKGNPNYVRSPSPERAQAFKREQEVRSQLESEERDDQEEEINQRAHSVDPVHAAMEQLRVELFAKIIGDIKQRIAVPTLHDFMAPENHVERRRKLNIAEPTEQKNAITPAVLLAGQTSQSRVPNNRNLGLGGFFRKTRGPSSVSIVKENRPSLNVFTDDRRRKLGRQKKPIAQAKSLSLHQQLAGFGSDEDTDDDTRSSREDSKDLESESISRMSSVAPAEDTEETTPRRRKRLQKEEAAAMDEDSDAEDYEGVSPDLDRTLLKKDVPIMSIQDLVAVVKGTSKESTWHQNAKRELEYRAKQKATDRMFGADAVDSDPDASILDELDMVNVQPTVEVEAPVKDKRKGKAGKRKTKKQLQEEREAIKIEAATKKDTEAPTVDIILPDVGDNSAPEGDSGEGDLEWRTSTTTPRRAVDDDPSLIKDIDGWQELVKDQEDFDAVKIVLANVKPARIKDIHRWAAQQKEIKAINNDGLRGPIYGELVIRGYYVPNISGCARTEGVKKILESEKSKYLEHRLRVAAAREARQAAAKSGTGNSAASDPLKGVKMQLVGSSSRSNRANKRTHAKDINALNTAKITAEGQAGDAIRFNNLQKRKKLVKFDRSAIHGWGLYAEEPITMNDMIIEYVGEKVRQAVANIREIRYDKQGVGSSYLFRIDEDMIVDATKKGGIARFINHSCSPNCTAKIIRVDGTKRIVIYALRDIGKDEELTYDYKFEREMDSEDRIPCLCGTELCKGFLN